MNYITEKESINIIKQYFKSNKVEVYKRKLVTPMAYEVIIIAVVDKKDIDFQISEFIKSDYHLKEIIKFDTSEALVESNKIEVDYLFFKTQIYIKG